MTGLPNRALFMDRLTHALTRAERTGTNLAVLFLDLDRFKILNDTLGREVGDRLLVEVGHRLAACLSPEDTVARLGGDEFALLLEDSSDLNAATALAERVSAEIQRPFVVEGRDVLISASIGIAPPAADPCSRRRCSTTRIWPCTRPRRRAARGTSSTSPA